MEEVIEICMYVLLILLILMTTNVLWLMVHTVKTAIKDYVTFNKIFTDYKRNAHEAQKFY